MMESQGPVDVDKQTLHAIIPGLDTKAAKKINKLKPLSIIGFSIVGIIGFVGYGIIFSLNIFSWLSAISLILITAGVYLPIAAFLMRKWSIEWNKNFETRG